MLLSLSLKSFQFLSKAELTLEKFRHKISLTMTVALLALVSLVKEAHKETFLFLSFSQGSEGKCSHYHCLGLFHKNIRAKF